MKKSAKLWINTLGNFKMNPTRNFPAHPKKKEIQTSIYQKTKQNFWNPITSNKKSYELPNKSLKFPSVARTRYISSCQTTKISLLWCPDNINNIYTFFSLSRNFFQVEILYLTREHSNSKKYSNFSHFCWFLRWLTELKFQE